MFCPHCERTILGALSGLPGLSNVRVSYRASTLSADWDRALLSEKQLADILANHGYTLKALRLAPSGCARLCRRRCRADSAVFRCGSLPARHMDRRFPDRQGGHESRRTVSRRLDDLAPLRRHVRRHQRRQRRKHPPQRRSL
ncbi:MAG: heavy-metal-associated domain-containing protein [Oscillospiraceae bacterium]